MTYPLPYAEISLRIDQLERALEDAYQHLSSEERYIVTQRIDYLATSAVYGDYDGDNDDSD